MKIRNCLFYPYCSDTHFTDYRLILFTIRSFFAKVYQNVFAFSIVCSSS